MERWHALFRDVLPPGEREHCERHLESCPRCQERLDQIGEVDEALRRRGRRVGDPTLAPPDPAWTRFLERVEGVRSAVRVGPAEPADLYFVRPDDRPGLLGTLGPYEVREVIGQGGMGVVLKAFDPVLHRLVAIKVLAPALAGSGTARRRFTREAQAAAALCHEHVVPVHGVHEANGLPYLVMQYVPGESLQERLDRGGPLPVEEVVRIGMQAASGLAAAHARGLIHRDVKPANLLLEHGLSRVKVTDFGLARMADDAGLTQAGVVAGTPEYMAPEQARGEVVDHRADLFSLGNVLYACCTGQPPFRGATPLAVLRQVSDEAPAPLRVLNPDIPAWLEALIGRLLEKEPARRFQAAAEVAALLEGYLAHLRQPATVPAPDLPPSAANACLVPSQPEWRTGAVRRRLPRWLPAALLLLTPLGTGIAFRLAGAGDPTPKADKEWKVFRQDFRGQKINDRFWTYEPPDAEQQIKEEAEGLRISTPGGDGQDRWRILGLSTRFPVRRDCEITVSYELLRADKPPAGKAYAAVGVSLAAVTDTPGRETALLARFHRADGQLYLCQKIFTDADGKRQYPTRVFPTEARSGKLRLVRRGDTFTYLVAEGDADEFRELHQFKLASTDLASVRVAAETQSAVDVRIRDFEVRAQGLPTEEPALAAADVPRKPAGEGWLAAAVILGLVSTAGIALGVWLTIRQGRRAGKLPERAPVGNEPGKAGAARPAVSFPCPGCGTPLRARAELAGKRVKCPGCGQEVAVPGLVTGSETAAGKESPRHRRWLPALLCLAGLGLGLGLLAAGLVGGGGGANEQAQPATAPTLHLLASEPDIDEQVLALAFTPDGKKLVTAGARYTRPGQFMVWDVTTGKELVRVRGITGTRAVAMSPDGQTVACGEFGGAVTLRDVGTGQVRGQATGHTIGVNSLAFSHDGTLLVSAGLDRVLKLWDVKGLQERQVFRGHTDVIFSVAFFGHGRAFVSGGQDKSGRIWDTATGEEKVTLLGHAAPVEMVAVSPDDKIVATASWDRTVKLWDPATGEELATLAGHNGSIFALAFSSDGKRLASGTDRGTVYLWDVETRRQVRTCQEHGAPVWSLAFSPDGKLLASGSSDTTARLWDVDGARDVATLSTAARGAAPVAVAVPVVVATPGARPAGPAANGWLTASGIVVLLGTLSGFVVWRLVRCSPRPAEALAQPTPALAARGQGPGTPPPGQGAAAVRGRFLPWIWPPALVLLAGLGLGTGFWLLGGNGPAQPAPEPNKAPPARGHVALDLRGGIDKLAPFALYGPDAETVAKPDSQGLRITLAAGRGDVAPVGLELPVRLRGDFDIVLGYELLAVGEPLPQYGSGLLIRAWFDAPSDLSVILGRSRTPSGERFGSHKVLKGPDGQEQYLNSRHLKATRSRGKLRLVRTGSQVQFLVAEEGQGFQAIQSLEIGTADVRTVQVECQTMWTPIALDVRLTELVVDAGQFPGGIPSARSADAPAVAVQRPARKGWLTALVLAALPLLAVVVLGAWLRSRQRRESGEKAVRGAGQAEQPRAGAAVAAIPLRCPQCGKTSKARAALAGKKVKCPGCGQAVLVATPPADGAGAEEMITERHRSGQHPPAGAGGGGQPT
jgi:serine/threonine protein kinase/predicted RNA-binding Zn-ribbon protein involved in translation (DUF1610 family)